MSKKLYVGNLSINSTEDDIRTQFSTFGEEIRVRLKTDKETDAILIAPASAALAIGSVLTVDCTLV